jgi:hypothetical protein
MSATGLPGAISEASLVWLVPQRRLLQAIDPRQSIAVR